jgi:hypothetical protein
VNCGYLWAVDKDSLCRGWPEWQVTMLRAFQVEASASISPPGLMGRQAVGCHRKRKERWWPAEPGHPSLSKLGCLAWPFKQGRGIGWFELQKDPSGSCGQEREKLEQLGNYCWKPDGDIVNFFQGLLHNPILGDRK